MVTPQVIFWANLLSAPALAAAPCQLPGEGAPRDAACPPLAAQLRAWEQGGSPEQLCDSTDDVWRRCKLRRLGLLSPEQLQQAESPASAVLASHYYAALLSSGTPEPQARAASLPVAGLPPQPRLVRLAVPPLPAPPALPTGDRSPACLPPLVIEASGRLSIAGGALSPDTTVEARLWTTIPALAEALQAAPPACGTVDIWASQDVRLDGVLPAIETIHRAGYRARLLALQDGHDSPYAPLVGVRLRLAPGGAAHPEARPVTGPSDIERGQGWTGRVFLRHGESTTVADLMAISRAADGDAVVWLSTTRDSLTPIDADTMLGELLLPGTPAAQALRRQIDPLMPEFAVCMNTALQRQPMLAGTINAELSVSGGAVQTARFSSETISDVGLLSCLSESVSGLQLDAQEPVVVGYTLHLRAE